MGYSYLFFIPWHTGTAQKPREAFKRIKSYREISTPAYQPDSNPVEFAQAQKDRQQHKRVSTATWRLLVSIILLSILVLFFGLWSQGFFYKNEIAAPATKEVFNAKAYAINIESGNRFLKDGMLDEALTDFAQAQKLAPQGIEANVGLTKTLLRKCSEQGLYCQLADKYLERLSEMPGLSSEQLIQIYNYN